MKGPNPKLRLFIFPPQMPDSITMTFSGFLLSQLFCGLTSWNLVVSLEQLEKTTDQKKIAVYLKKKFSFNIKQCFILFLSISKVCSLDNYSEICLQVWGVAL